MADAAPPHGPDGTAAEPAASRAASEQAAPRRPRRLRRVLLVAAVVAGLALLGVIAWAGTPRTLEEDRFEAVIDDPAIVVDEGEGYLRLTPADAEPDLGVVFYPGARVPPGAYAATWAEVLRRTDVTVLIPSVTLNLAVLSPNRAADVIAAEEGIERWWVGGHSLGGTMAASYASDDPDVEGLLLWASFPTEGSEVAAREDLVGASIAGSRDGLSTLEEITARAGLLPDGVPIEVIEGMNHAQFGAYGEQARDGEPTLSDAEAAEALAEVTAEALEAGR